METLTNQNQIMVKMALDAWNAQVQSAEKLLASVSDEQLLAETAPGRNRGVYLLGHIAAVNDRMLPLLNLGDANYPHLTVPFLGKADREVAELPSAAEIRKFWFSSCEALSKQFNSMSANDWFDKHTSVNAEDFAKEPHRNKLNVLISRTGHLAYHLGQLAYLKSK